jgi:membrane-bound lytic murein transglycosylase B
MFFTSSMRRVLLCTLVALMTLGAVFTDSYLAHAQTASDVAARKAQLQSQLDSLETQIAETQTALTSLKGQGQSLQRDINILDAGIKKSQLQIKATQVQIEALSQNISIHTNTVTTLSGQLDVEKKSVEDILRKTQQIDDYSLVEVILSSQDVSGFFADLDAFAALQKELQASTQALDTTRSATLTEKDALVDQRGQQQKLRDIQAAEQAKIVEQQGQKKKLLASNKSTTATYQSIYDIQQKTATQIRAELFALAGGSGTISLPVAITLAKQAGASTGVRPAFILGILKQETNIGQNLGNGNWQVDMHPTRDVPVFQTIMANLGLSPDSVKVSKASPGGYGGAMGPSQFIPSTWACYGGYVNTTTGSCGKNPGGGWAGPWQYSASKDRIAQDAGHPGTPSNPYNNLDAFTATALYMADLGATAQTPVAERTAALKYYAGGGWANPAYAFYGEGVMGFADQFQSDIDTLGG